MSQIALTGKLRESGHSHKMTFFLPVWEQILLPTKKCSLMWIRKGKVEEARGSRTGSYSGENIISFDKLRQQNSLSSLYLFGSYLLYIYLFMSIYPFN